MPRLVNVKLDLKLPGIGIQGTWEPDECEIRAAWELYVELVTRSPLGEILPAEGLTRESLSSIYSLFDTTRAILRSSGPSVARPRAGRRLSFGYLAVSMLNLVLRPLLSKWRPRILLWEHTNPDASERDWEWVYGRELLDDLSAVKEQLEQYADLFTEVAGVPELLTEITDATDTSP